MEICLNALWIAVSLLLVSWWLRGLTLRGERANWQAAVAVALLIVLLFPVISMTDDLLLASAPAETEHLLRRVEVSLEQGLSLTPMAVLAGVMALLSTLLLCCVLAMRPAVRMWRWHDVLLRSAGVRPPPAPATLALA